MKRILALPLLAATLALPGCVSITSVPPGPTRVGAAQVNVTREWSDITVLMPVQAKKVRVLSTDGPLLNRLYITDGLAAGDYLVKALVKEQPTPTIRAGMSNTERVEFVADSVAAMGYQRVETDNLRRASLQDQPAVRFDLTARTTEGLDIKGTGIVSEIGGKTYVVLFLAPAEHYFQAGLQEVEAIIGSARHS